MSPDPLVSGLREALSGHRGAVVHAPGAPLGRLGGASGRPTFVCLDPVAAVSVSAALGATPVLVGTPRTERAKALSRDPSVASPAVVTEFAALADPVVGPELLAGGPIEALVPGADALRPECGSAHPAAARALRLLGDPALFARVLLLADDPDLAASRGLARLVPGLAPDPVRLPAAALPIFQAVGGPADAARRIPQPGRGTVLLLPAEARGATGAIEEALGEAGIDHRTVDLGEEPPPSRLAEDLSPAPRRAVVLVGGPASAGLGGADVLVVGRPPGSPADIGSWSRCPCVLRLDATVGPGEAELAEREARQRYAAAVRGAVPRESWVSDGFDPPGGAVAWREVEGPERSLWADLAAAGLCVEVVPTSFRADLADTSRFRRPYVDDVPGLRALHATYERRLAALPLLQAGSRRLTGGKSYDLRDLAPFLGVRIPTLVGLLAAADDARVVPNTVRRASARDGADIEIVLGPDPEGDLAGRWAAAWARVESYRAARARERDSALLTWSSGRPWDVQAAADATSGDGGTGVREGTGAPTSAGAPSGAPASSPRVAGRGVVSVEQARALDRLFGRLAGGGGADPSGDPGDPDASTPRFHGAQAWVGTHAPPAGEVHARRAPPPPPRPPPRAGPPPEPRAGLAPTSTRSERGRRVPDEIPTLPGLAALASGDPQRALDALRAAAHDGALRAAAVVLAFDPRHGPPGGPSHPCWDLGERRVRAAEAVWDQLGAPAAHFRARMGAGLPDAFVERTPGGTVEVYIEAGEGAGVLALTPVPDIEAVEDALFPAAPPSWLPARRARRLLAAAASGVPDAAATAASLDDLTAVEIPAEPALGAGIEVLRALRDGDGEAAAASLRRLAEADPRHPALAPLAARVAADGQRWEDVYALPAAPRALVLRASLALSARCAATPGCPECDLRGTPWCPADATALDRTLGRALAVADVAGVARRLARRSAEDGFVPSVRLVQAVLRALPDEAPERAAAEAARFRARAGSFREWTGWAAASLARGDAGEAARLLERAVEDAGAPDARALAEAVAVLGGATGDQGDAALRARLDPGHPVALELARRSAAAESHRVRRAGHLAAFAARDLVTLDEALSAVHREDPDALSLDPAREAAARVREAERRYLDPIRADIEACGREEARARHALAEARADGVLEWLLNRLAALAGGGASDPGPALWSGRALLGMGEIDRAGRAFADAVQAVRNPARKVEWTLEWFAAAWAVGERNRALSGLETAWRAGIDARTADARLDGLFTSGALPPEDGPELRKVLERVGGERCFPRTWARVRVLEDAEPWKRALAKLKLGGD